jgi:RNA polymerase sigma-70 factor (ECF subfamily)
MQEIVRRTLAGLPAQTRRIFSLSRYENKSYKEIAAECGMSVKGVEFHIAKALKILRQNLKDYFPLLGMLLAELLS